MISILMILLYYYMFIYGNLIKVPILTIVNLSVFVLLFILTIMFNKTIIKNDLCKLKNDFKTNIKYIIIYSIIAAIGYSVVSILVGSLLDSVVITEESVADSNLIQVFFNLLIWAPITEELLFRSQLNKNIKNKVLFIILSSVLFAGVHVLGNGFNYVTLLSSIPYLVLGIYFALLYKKTNNIIINIVMHLLINVIGVITILSMI